MSETNETPREFTRSEKKFELICGITLALFAAFLAITDLGAGKYGDDEIIGNNAKANVYAWFQSKSIKQSLIEGQNDLIKTLVAAGGVKEEQLGALNTLSTKLDGEIERYKKEKKELLLGSAAVGKENWVQDVDGELGKVIGAKEWEKKLDALGQAGDLFDMALLFLQLTLVLGAVSLVLQNPRTKWVFYLAMILIGIIGTIYSAYAYSLALSV